MQRGQHAGAAPLGIGDDLADRGIGQGGIERRYRLVGQDQFRLLVEHAGDADALQLAAGKSVATVEQAVGQVEARQHLLRPGNVGRVEQRGQPLPGRPAAQAPGKDGGDHPQARRNRRRLVDGTDARAQPAQLGRGKLPGVAAEQFDAPAAGPQGAAEQANQAGLAGARRPDHGDALAAGEAQVEAVQRTQAVAVHQAELMGDEGHGLYCRPAPRAIARAAAPTVRCYLISPALRAAASMPS
jgi:hypothetical protein